MSAPTTQSHLLLPESHAARLRAYVRESLLRPDADTASLRALARELDRARTVADRRFPADTVTLGAAVRVEYPDTGDTLEFTLLIPGDRPDALPEPLSVLSPLGLALLGARLEDEVEWPLTRGALRIRVAGVETPRPVTAA